ALPIWLSRAALRCLPILLVAALVPAPYGLRLTVSPGTLALFLVSMVLMLVLVCAYTMVLYGLGFYLESTNGVRWLSLAAADLLGGAIVPLPFLPERSEEHTSELQSRFDLVCRLLLEINK